MRNWVKNLKKNEPLVSPYTIQESTCQISSQGMQRLRNCGTCPKRPEANPPIFLLCLGAKIGALCTPGSYSTIFFAVVSQKIISVNKKDRIIDARIVPVFRFREKRSSKRKCNIFPTDHHLSCLPVFPSFENTGNVQNHELS